MTAWKSWIKEKISKRLWEYLSLERKAVIKVVSKISISNWLPNLFSILTWTCSYPNTMEEFTGSMDFHMSPQSDFSLWECFWAWLFTTQFTFKFLSLKFCTKSYLTKIKTTTFHLNCSMIWLTLNPTFKTALKNYCKQRKALKILKCILQLSFSILEKELLSSWLKMEQKSRSHRTTSKNTANYTRITCWTNK